MTNRSTRIRSGKKRGIRLVDLEFRGESQEKENLENGRRPHGGYKGSKKHPLSPYSYNREPNYLQGISDEVDRSHHDEFVEGHRSPFWAINTSRQSNHSGESPLFVHGLLSSSKYDTEGQGLQEPRPKPTVRGRSAPPKRSGTLYYRPNTTHQYLSATELRQTPQSPEVTNIKYGRPTRTTLLRARQRSNSAPVNAYMQRREQARKMESTQYSTVPSSKDADDYSSDEDNDYMYVMYVIADRYLPTRRKEESSHAFLTGARYNRAHLLDAKGLSVYGVYMPRKNPMACFMTGPASSRLKDSIEEVPSAPPDTPRSELSDYHEHVRKAEFHPRPSTAPGKRLLSGKVVTHRDRPKSAWGDAATSCDIVQNESEILTDEAAYKQHFLESLILTSNGLNVQGSGVLVSLRSSKQYLRASDSTLPTVTGVSVPKVIFRRPRDAVEETSLVNQPPPTPTGASSRDESEQLRNASLSVRDSSTGRAEDSSVPVIAKHINIGAVDTTFDSKFPGKTETVEPPHIEPGEQTETKTNTPAQEGEIIHNVVVDSEKNMNVFITEGNSKTDNKDIDKIPPQRNESTSNDTNAISSEIIISKTVDTKVKISENKTPVEVPHVPNSKVKDETKTSCDRKDDAKKVEMET